MAGVLVVLNHDRSSINEWTRDTLTRIVMICGMGIPLFLGIKLALERKTASIAIQVLAWILPGLALVGYGVFMIPDFKMIAMTRYSLLIGAIILGFIVVPFFFRKKGFPLYTTGFIIRVLVSVLYSGILMLSLFAILFTLNKLLSVNINDRTYSDIAILVWAAFAPTFFIAGIPPADAEPSLSDSPKTLRFLMIYILIPLLTVYALILYAYSARILINLAWPEGMVSSLVLSFVTISILIIFLVTPIQEGNRLAVVFTTWFPRAALPLFIMLFAALGIRIGRYGFTEPRYFASVLAVWCFGVMLYLILTKRKYLIILPISLALVAVLSVIGPVSAYSVSGNSQNTRFETILARNNMLQDGQVVRAQNAPPEADQREMGTILQYFERNNRLDKVRSLPSDFRLENSEAVLGFNYIGLQYPSENLYVSFYRENTLEPISVAGFDYLIPLRDASSGNKQPKGISASYSNNTMILDVLLDDVVVYSKNLSDTMKSLSDKYAGTNKQLLSAEDLTINEESDRLSVRILLLNIGGNLPDASTNQQLSGYVDGYVLVRLK